MGPGRALKVNMNTAQHWCGDEVRSHLLVLGVALSSFGRGLRGREAETAEFRVESGRRAVFGVRSVARERGVVFGI